MPNKNSDLPVITVRIISEAKNSQSGINYTTTATIAKELLDAGTSPTAEAMINQSSPVKKAPTEDIKPAVAEVSPTKIEPNNNNIGETTKPAPQSHGGIRATDQLLYLADLLKFEVYYHSSTFNVRLFQCMNCNFRFNLMISPEVITKII